MLQLDDLYQSLTDRHDSQEVVDFDDFLDLSDKNDAGEPDSSDIVLDLLGGDDGEDNDNEYIYIWATTRPTI